MASPHKTKYIFIYMQLTVDVIIYKIYLVMISKFVIYKSNV